jgi:hypothetical protein
LGISFDMSAAREKSVTVMLSRRFTRAVTNLTRGIYAHRTRRLAAIDANVLPHGFRIELAERSPRTIAHHNAAGAADLQFGSRRDASAVGVVMQVLQNGGATRQVKTALASSDNLL